VSVLGKREILRRFDELFPDGRDEWKQNVKAAKYYLTLSGRYLIRPDGKRFGPDDNPARHLVLQPGQTAYVSSEERVVIPDDCVGIIGPRFSSAEQGLFFFGGMLVDPGWGRRADYRPWGEPLSFTIANLGRQPIELRPGEDVIASLAFMKVKKPGKHSHDPEVTDKPIQFREELFAPGNREPCSALGLVEELDSVRAEVRRLKDSQTNIILLGVVVLAASLFAGIVAAILGSSGENGAAELSVDAWPTIVLGLILMLVTVLGIIAVFYAALELRVRRSALRKGKQLRG
jgi:deoxycytidine triphosphate deaminase